MKRKILVALFSLLSLYPPAELTRYILAYEKTYGFAPQFKFELWFIWIGYALMMNLFCIILYTKWED